METEEHNNCFTFVVLSGYKICYWFLRGFGCTRNLVMFEAEMTLSKSKVALLVKRDVDYQLLEPKL